MGFLRKSIIVATGGLAPIKPRSYRERTAKAAEAQLRLQQQEVARQAADHAPRFEINCPYCNRVQTASTGTVHCTNCHGKIKVSGPQNAVRTR